MSDFLVNLSEKRRKFLEGLDANEGAINLDIFEDFYPDEAHFVFELLQNAEDAEATEVSFDLTEFGCLFEHNGKRLFSEEDVDSITGIHNSSKKESGEKIGKFGVGFKSVFVYTLSPEIRSGKFAFRISRLVMPESLEDDGGDRSVTRFWFPFNNPKKPKDVAYREVGSGLRDLAETTLLFLSNIDAINWKIDDGQEGSVLRVEHSEEHVEVLKESGGSTTASSHFLRFSETVEGLEKQKLAIAFKLEPAKGDDAFQAGMPMAQQFKIAPVNGQVAVFFPAEKETSGLRFHLHAPFVPELSRASIKDTAVNLPLFEQISLLSVRALHGVKILGFLTTELLGVLPNPNDRLGERYEVIREKIIEAFNEEPLTPTFNKGHEPARNLLQAKASLKELLTENDIEFLVDYDDIAPKWAASRALQGTNVERFMNGLAIKDWDVYDFLEEVVSNTDEEWGGPNERFMEWLEAKPTEWFQRMYAVFAREPETLDELHQLKDAKIVKLFDGSFSVPRNCYFPDEKREYIEIVPCVDPEILEAGNSEVSKKAAHKFLKEVGVGEIGEQELIQSLLDADYTSEERALRKKKYVSDLRRFIRFLDENPYQGSVFSGKKLFLGDDGSWHSGGEIFLDKPFLETGLTEYFDIVELPGDLVPLSEEYLGMAIDLLKVARFAEKIDARRHIQIRSVSCRGNPRWDYLRSAPGERYTSPVDEDFRILKFEEFAEANSKQISSLIWKTMKDAPTNVLTARFRKNTSGGMRQEDSQLVYQLRRAAWVPQGDRFVKPAAAKAELLPDGFGFDPGWEWIKDIEFGKEVELENERVRAEAEAAIERKNKRQAAAAELGFEDPNDLAWLEKVSEFPPEQREAFLSEWNQRKAAAELPEHEPRNPERRAERVGELAGEATERTTEERKRSVSVGLKDVKAEAAEYLCQQYSGDDGIICQVCEGPVPFLLDNGTPYFERVEFLSELKRRHHQNYLALCPNHAAMFKHANGTKELMKDMFLELDESRLEVILAQQNTTIYFTNTHIADLKKVIEVDKKLAAESEPE